MKTLLPAALALAWSTAGAQVSPYKLMPAGLYRIDMATDIIKLQMPIRIEHQADGATGSETVHTTVRGEQHTGKYQGNGPRTLCVQPIPANLPPVAGIPGNCKQQSTKETPDGFIHVAHCPGHRLTLTGRKIEGDTWDLVYDSMSTPDPGPPDLSGLRAAMTRMASTGTQDEPSRSMRISRMTIRSPRRPMH